MFLRKAWVVSTDTFLSQRFIQRSLWSLITLTWLERCTVNVLTVIWIHVERVYRTLNIMERMKLFYFSPAFRVTAFSEKFVRRAVDLPSFGIINVRATQNLSTNFSIVSFPIPFKIPGVPSFLLNPGSKLNLFCKDSAGNARRLFLIKDRQVFALRYKGSCIIQNSAWGISWTINIGTMEVEYLRRKDITVLPWTAKASPLAMVRVALILWSLFGQ